eukprot:GHUV01054529.1.p1 GENE.GHUV01054529.1~~GHUV01054529.1.p1  ORF type:complete len:141 (-),score=34.80 GHUV01054529.1:42-464(-)
MSLALCDPSMLTGLLLACQLECQLGPREVLLPCSSSGQLGMVHSISSHTDSGAASMDTASTGSSITALSWYRSDLKIIPYVPLLLQDAVDCGWLRESVDGPASLLKVIATATEVASGILALHRAGVVHGDLSAFNVLLTR